MRQFCVFSSRNYTAAANGEKQSELQVNRKVKEDPFIM